MGTSAGLILLAGFAAAGVLYTTRNLASEAASMETQHWIMFAVILVIGYVAGRLWPAPAQMFGLP